MLVPCANTHDLRPKKDRDLDISKATAEEFARLVHAGYETHALVAKDPDYIHRVIASASCEAKGDPQDLVNLMAIS
ncbi:hypothetical protein M436DRAFT_85297 [Aureobasidium namibiae CBS 147.97]|uniref:Uncharacterized protein n=1 Tax=Aureobasidium namibiae CBS 147.97 TaxID=1043004 RepID=A0A074X469_9PEZI